MAKSKTTIKVKNPKLKVEAGDVFETNIHFGKKAVIAQSFKANKYMTRKQIFDYVKQTAQDFKYEGLNVNFQVTAEFPAYWRPGKFLNVNDIADATDDDMDLVIYNKFDKNNPSGDFDDSNPNYDMARRFNIYMSPNLQAPRRGGNSNKNDCLWLALAQAFGDRHNLPNEINSPKKLKSFLKLDRNDTVDIKYISKIDELFESKKTTISIYGDHEYLSSRNEVRNVRILLKAGHYSLRNNEGRERLDNVWYKPRNTVIVMKQQEDKKLIFDGIEERLITQTQLDKLVKQQDVLLLVCKNATKPLKEMYDEFINKAETLKRVTKGTIDFYKYPSDAMCALDMFRMFSKSLLEPEEMDEIESTWHLKTNAGGLIGAVQYNSYGCSFDCNSAYPFYMKSNYFQMPVKQGEFKMLTQSEFKQLKYYKYGIYRVNIKKNNDPKLSMYFRIKDNNYYTHYDLSVAKEIGLQMELIEDGQPNFLYYSKDKLVSGKIFEQFVEYFYKLKLNPETKQYVKNIISSLWGAMCTRKFVYKVTEPNKTLHIDDHEFGISSIEPVGKETQVKCYKHNQIYEYDYARIGCFLTSFVRMQMSKIIRKIGIEYVVRVHTDGIIVNSSHIQGTTEGEDLCAFEKLTKCTMGNGLGEWKIEKTKEGKEKCGSVHIENSNKITWIV